MPSNDRVTTSACYADWSRPVEFFEPNAKLDHESRRTNDRKVKFFNQTAMWQGLLLKQEFKLKLLSCLDDYLAAVDSENPVLVYLSARYLLELVATIAYLDSELREALKANAFLTNSDNRPTLRRTIVRLPFASTSPG